MTKQIDDLLAEIQDVERQMIDRLWAKAKEAGSILAEIDPTKRRALFSLMRDEMLMKQGRRCAGASCQKILAEGDIHEDHIIPISYGGGNERSNLRLLCSECNLRRGNRLEGHVEIEMMILHIEDTLRNLPPKMFMAYKLKASD